MCFKKYKIFPILIYSPGDKNIEVTECCICFNELKDPIHLECGHGFHIKCILKWFEKKMECPICRTKYEIELG